METILRFKEEDLIDDVVRYMSKMEVLHETRREKNGVGFDLKQVDES